MQKIFNRSRHFQNRARFAGVRARHDALFTEMAAGLAERLSFVKRDFRRILEVGSREESLRTRLLEADPEREVVQADFNEEEILAPLPLREGVGEGYGNTEKVFSVKASSLHGHTYPTPLSPPSRGGEKGYDLVISNLALHWMNDVPGALIQMRMALKPDGFFLAALLGGETLYELRDCLYEAEMEIRGGVTPRVSPFMDLRDGGMLLQRAGFALPVADRERWVFAYPDIFSLIRELRGMGETSAAFVREKYFAPKSLFIRAGEIYREKYPQEKGIQATFDVLVLSGWSAHESQQKPLKPGEAEFSLAETLNVHETKVE